MGFDRTIGYLKGGIAAWKEAGMEVDSVNSVPASELDQNYKESETQVFDVRKESEYASEHIVNAKNTPLGKINNYLSQFPKDENFYLHCAGGYRSMIATSILKSRGIHNIIDVQGGFGAIKETNIPRTEFVCPTTL